MLCEMSFEEFHNDGHLGNWNGEILAILNLHVALMTPIECHFWISERNQFNIAVISMLARCLPPIFASIRRVVWSCFKNFKMDDVLNYIRNITILAILNLNVDPIPLIKL